MKQFELKNVGKMLIVLCLGFIFGGFITTFIIYLDGLFGENIQLYKCASDGFDCQMIHTENGMIIQNTMLAVFTAVGIFLFYKLIFYNSAKTVNAKKKVYAK